MSPRTRLAVAATAAAAVLAGLASQLPFARWLAPPLARTPALEARGREVLAQRCLHCHDQIPLSPRVRGWSVERAYAALGRLPELNASMPAFHGTDEERRALAAWLAAAGEGAAAPAGTRSTPP